MDASFFIFCPTVLEILPALSIRIANPNERCFTVIVKRYCFYYPFVIVMEARLKQSPETTDAVKEIASRRHTGQHTMFAMTSVFVWF